MKHDIAVNHTITIPFHEVEVTASRSGGPGGQHVNKTSTRITVRWNIHNSAALDTEQKELILTKLQNQLTNEGDLIIHNSSSRSQQQNKLLAFAQLAKIIRKALYLPKKRMATKVSAAAKEARLHHKQRKGAIKRLRSKKFDDE